MSVLALKSDPPLYQCAFEVSLKLRRAADKGGLSDNDFSKLFAEAAEALQFTYSDLAELLSICDIELIEDWSRGVNQPGSKRVQEIILAKLHRELDCRMPSV